MVKIDKKKTKWTILLFAIVEWCNHTMLCDALFDRKTILIASLNAQRFVSSSWSNEICLVFGFIWLHLNRAFNQCPESKRSFCAIHTTALVYKPDRPSAVRTCARYNPINKLTNKNAQRSSKVNRLSVTLVVSACYLLQHYEMAVY